MKCRQVQQRLLATSGPRKLAPEVHAHLDICSDCRQWQEKLADIDRGVSRLPVPSSTEAKAAVIEQILTEPVTPSVWWKQRLPGTTRQKALIGLAATVLVVLAGTAIFNSGRPTQVAAAPPDPLLERLLQRNLTLARDPNPRKTMETLSALADDLDGETRNLARVASSKELEELANLYDDVVRKGIVARAGDLAPDERKNLLPDIADHLFQTSRSAERLAQEMPHTAAGPLKKIANTARDANAALRNLTKDEKVAHDSPSVGGAKS